MTVEQKLAWLIESIKEQREKVERAEDFIKRGLGLCTER